MTTKADASRQALVKALKILSPDRKNGGQVKLGKKIGASQPQIWHWLHKAKKGVPAKYWPKIEKAVKGQVSFPK